MLGAQKGKKKADEISENKKKYRSTKTIELNKNKKKGEQCTKMS